MKAKRYFIILGIFLEFMAGKDPVLTRVGWFPKESEKPVFKTATNMLIYKGRIFVVDNFKHRVLVYTKKGNFDRFIGRPGQGPGDLNLPVEISIYKDVIAVKDEIGFSFFQLNGKFLRKFRVFTPRVSFVWRKDKIFYANADVNSPYLIKVLSEKGRVLYTFGRKSRILPVYSPRETIKPFESVVFSGKLLADRRYLFYVNYAFARLTKISFNGEILSQVNFYHILFPEQKKWLRENKDRVISGKIRENQWILIRFLFQDSYMDDGKIYVMEKPIKKDKMKIVKIITVNSVELKVETIYKIELTGDEQILAFAVCKENKKPEFYIAMRSEEGNVIARYKEK